MSLYGALGGIAGLYGSYVQQQVSNATQDRMNAYRQGASQLAAQGAYIASMAQTLNFLCTAPPSRRAIEYRWRSRMLRIQAKRWDRRKMILGEIGWRLGLVWGGIAAVLLTVALVSFCLRAVLG